MKLESLKLEKFKKESLKREHMFVLNGGLADAGAAGTVTPGGHGCYTSPVYPYRTWECDYGYDSDRGGYTTYHNRTNHVEISSSDCANINN